jgi:hypothetical protein
LDPSWAEAANDAIGITAVAAPMPPVRNKSRRIELNTPIGTILLRALLTSTSVSEGRTI